MGEGKASKARGTAAATQYLHAESAQTEGERRNCRQQALRKADTFR
jgi:hypothetical protein